jgi:hypothetical protein
VTYNISTWAIDLNRIWTSADASCLSKYSERKRKCSGVRWCSTGRVLRKTLPIRVPAKIQDSCLAYERRLQRFTYKSCESRFHFVCEVRPNIVYICFTNLINKYFFKYGCKEALCPGKNQCLTNVNLFIAF